ncbi:hypothetical protein PFISCL1PPCAC_23170 [Pristionchus fissidentatus]|uniref:Uncharacterized protein n=1 Tax=Pristionchus fissidentatus TaxID=1538716 RepID=A0AAV5WNM3_9BILA|nr:hypothetical protein PFISCL1PPCAC_23170 [Pristionchus fissidentatus]
MDWAIRSSVPINSLTLEKCHVDPQVIADLPRMARLFVSERRQWFSSPRYTDSQLLAIARIGHGDVSLPADPSEIGTIRALIGVVHSSDHTLEFSIEVHHHPFSRFLESVNLREVGNRLLDVTNAPVLWGQNNNDNPFYYLDYGYGYLKVSFYDSSFAQTVTIVKGEKPRYLGPSHPLILPL